MTRADLEKRLAEAFQREFQRLGRETLCSTAEAWRGIARIAAEEIEKVRTTVVINADAYLGAVEDARMDAARKAFKAAREILNTGDFAYDEEHIARILGDEASPTIGADTTSHVTQGGEEVSASTVSETGLSANAAQPAEPPRPDFVEPMHPDYSIGVRDGSAKAYEECAKIAEDCGQHPPLRYPKLTTAEYIAAAIRAAARKQP